MEGKECLHQDFPVWFQRPKYLATPRMETFLPSFSRSCAQDPGGPHPLEWRLFSNLHLTE